MQRRLPGGQDLADDREPAPQIGTGHEFFDGDRAGEWRSARGDRIGPVSKRLYLRSSAGTGNWFDRLGCGSVHSRDDTSSDFDSDQHNSNSIANCHQNSDCWSIDRSVAGRTGLNLRAGAGTSFPVIRILQRNEIVEVTGSGVTAGSYVFVPIRAVNDNATGWVAQQYLDRVVSTSGDACRCYRDRPAGVLSSTQVPVRGSRFAADRRPGPPLDP